MNHLIYLNPQSGELEKILSGTKTMILKESGDERSDQDKVNPGDSLFFIRGTHETTLRVKATVINVIYAANQVGSQLESTLKELQSKIQLTEDQFSFWSRRKQVMLVEFLPAHKIEGIEILARKAIDGSGWISFEDFCINE